MAKKLRCRIGRHHWVRMSLDGQFFAECSDCKERDWDRYQDRKGSGTAIGQGITPGGGFGGVGGGF
jgi:hypothetical protein